MYLLRILQSVQNLRGMVPVCFIQFAVGSPWGYLQLGAQLPDGTAAGFPEDKTAATGLLRPELKSRRMSLPPHSPGQSKSQG